MRETVTLAYIHSWAPVWLPRESSLETKPRSSSVALILKAGSGSSHRLLRRKTELFRNYDGEWIIGIISSLQSQQCLCNEVYFHISLTWSNKWAHLHLHLLAHIDSPSYISGSDAAGTKYAVNVKCMYMYDQYEQWCVSAVHLWSVRLSCLVKPSVKRVQVWAVTVAFIISLY